MVQPSFGTGQQRLYPDMARKALVPLEFRHAVCAAHHRFAVDRRRPYRRRAQRGGDRGDSVGPVVAPAGERAHLVAVVPADEAATVVLYPMSPQRTSWHDIANCRQAGRDESAGWRVVEATGAALPAPPPDHCARRVPKTAPRRTDGAGGRFGIGSSSSMSLVASAAVVMRRSTPISVTSPDSSSRSPRTTPRTSRVHAEWGVATALFVLVSPCG